MGDRWLKKDKDMPAWVGPTVAIVTAVVAVLALLLGVFNTLTARPRLKILLGGALDPPRRIADELSTDATMEVYNPSRDPMWVLEAGFEFLDGTNVTIGHFEPGTSSSQVLPYWLRGQESFLAFADALLLGQHEPKNPAVRGWVRRGGGKMTTKRLPRGWFKRYAEEAGKRQEARISGG